MVCAHFCFYRRDGSRFCHRNAPYRARNSRNSCGHSHTDFPVLGQSEHHGPLKPGRQCGQVSAGHLAPLYLGFHRHTDSGVYHQHPVLCCHRRDSVLVFRNRAGTRDPRDRLQSADGARPGHQHKFSHCSCPDALKRSRRTFRRSLRTVSGRG